jgi:hypothetical protein
MKKQHLQRKISWLPLALLLAVALALLPTAAPAQGHITGRGGNMHAALKGNEVELSPVRAGKLESMIPPEKFNQIRGIRVYGPMNDADM